MNKGILVVIILVLVGLGVWFLTSPKATEVKLTSSHQAAELVGYNFMLDFIAMAPGNDDIEAAERVYQSLSQNARQIVSQEKLLVDLAQFIGVQDVPDQGVSVEDLQVIDEKNVNLILGLNYSGGITMRLVGLVVEDGLWKVDQVSPYQPEEGQVVEEEPIISAT